MEFLKGLALTLLGFLLFFSLSIFGLVFALNQTLMSPDFVTSELDRLDISALRGELFTVQGAAESQYLVDAIDKTIDDLEPLAKEQLSTATYSIYDYLLGKKQSPELALTLRNTFFSSDFVIALVDRLDVASLAGAFLRAEISAGIPGEARYLTEHLDEYLDDVIVELEPWIKEQVEVAADPTLDYLLGERQTLRVVISLQPVKELLKDRLWRAVSQSPPPELAQIPRAELRRYFDEFYREFAAQIPATFELDESLFPADVPAQIAESLAEVEEALEQARQYVTYFQLGYLVLIGFMVLLVLGIVLIRHDVKGVTRSLGISALAFGIFGYGGSFASKYVLGSGIALSGMPSLQTWLVGFLDRLLAPLEMFSLGILIGGVVLIVISFVYRPRQTES